MTNKVWFDIKKYARRVYIFLLKFGVTLFQSWHIHLLSPFVHARVLTMVVRKIVCMYVCVRKSYTHNESILILQRDIPVHGIVQSRRIIGFTQVKISRKIINSIQFLPMYFVNQTKQYIYQKNKNLKSD